MNKKTLVRGLFAVAVVVVVLVADGKYTPRVYGQPRVHSADIRTL